MKTFGRYYGGTILRPRHTLDLLMQDRRHGKYGVWALLINAAMQARGPAVLVGAVLYIVYQALFVVFNQ